jgi:hypothetical protein
MNLMLIYLQTLMLMHGGLGWGSEDLDRRGSLIETILLENHPSVLNPCFRSDYFPILISYFILRLARWDKFTQLMTSLRLSDLPHEEAVRSFYSLLLNAASQTIPSLTTIHTRPLVPWWSHKCAVVVRQRKRAQKTLQTTSYPAKSTRISSA